MTRIHRKSGPPTRESQRDMIESVLKQLRPPFDAMEEAYQMNNKMILVEDFGLENDPELRDLVLNYVPQDRGRSN